MEKARREIVAAGFLTDGPFGPGAQSERRRSLAVIASL